MDNEVRTQDASVAPIVENNISKERMIPQSEVDKLVYGVKRESYEKGQREAQAAEEARRAQMVAPMQAGMPQAQSMGGMPQLSQEQVRQMIADEAQKRAREEHAMRFANDFVGKLEAGKSKYDSQDFDKTMQDLNLQSIPHVLELTGGVDNAADVMYHLGKNPTKLGSLVTLAYVNPKLAQVEMHKLSESLRTNESASHVPSINEPLSQIKRSTVGADTGKRTVADLRKDPRFRR